MKHSIGVQIVYTRDMDLEAEIRKAMDMELESCQLCIWDEKIYTDEYVNRVNEAVARTGFRISSVWAGWDGPCEWNFTYGPVTIGLVPAAYRESRLRSLKKAADFALAIGVDRIVTHVGFIPEDPNHPDFMGTVGALRNLCKYLKPRNQYFLFETGQETPLALLRTIETIGYDNLGINYDTANLVLYGKANSVDAVEMLGKYIMETHIKDGFYPTDTLHHGKQATVGEGQAQVEEVVKRLDTLGYTGTYTIEREISGEQQIRDILATRDLLRIWMD
ncbi:MAG: sugar phosphate isomerase/epimerase [Clostridia bacterium]|nr:sugar phosphate isomerase/epimerase [Clostridia bacterium]